jgi:MYXO-CTERM domain-containing protein
MFRNPCARRLLGGVIVVSVCGVCDAAPIVEGIYKLSDHPGGSASPPTYGLRLDELYDEDPGAASEDYTFSFDHPLASVTMSLSDTDNSGSIDRVLILGTMYGGRDVGGGWAPEGPGSNTGRYEIRFDYRVGVTENIGGDDDLAVVAPTASNSGWIQPFGAPAERISLFDKSNGSLTFRLGDQDGDGGHRGHPGISGWGWLNHGAPDVHHAFSDWLFTAEFIDVPTPGAVALAAFAGATGLRRRRR